MCGSDGDMVEKSIASNGKGVPSTVEFGSNHLMAIVQGACRMRSIPWSSKENALLSSTAFHMSPEAFDMLCAGRRFKKFVFKCEKFAFDLLRMWRQLSVGVPGRFDEIR